jgi:hypothetical protein
MFIFNLPFFSSVWLRATSTRADLRYEGAPAESLVGRSHDVEQRVHEVLAMMGLEEVADLAVGTHNARIIVLPCLA